MYKKTNKKVEVCNGAKRYERCVWVDEQGVEFFKDCNEWNRIYERSDRPNCFNAPYYNGVVYVTW